MASCLRSETMNADVHLELSAMIHGAKLGDVSASIAERGSAPVTSAP
jgi:hypothetical protein